MQRGAAVPEKGGRYSVVRRYMKKEVSAAWYGGT